MTSFITAAIVVGVLGMWGFIGYAIVFIPIPEGNRDMFNMLLGGSGVAVTTIVGWRFGSSSGSAGKDRVIDKLTEGNGS